MITAFYTYLSALLSHYHNNIVHELPELHMLIVDDGNGHVYTVEVHEVQDVDAVMGLVRTE